MFDRVSVYTQVQRAHSVRINTNAGDLVVGSVPHRLSCPIRMSWSVVWSGDDALKGTLSSPHLPLRLEQVHTQLLRRIVGDIIVPAADQMHGAYGHHLRTVTPWLQHVSASLETMCRHAATQTCSSLKECGPLLPVLLRADHIVHPPHGFALAWPHATDAHSPRLVSDDLPALSSDATGILTPRRRRSSSHAPSSEDVWVTPSP